MRKTQKFNRLISFASVHHAIKAEKLLRQAGIIVSALPTPREIDISCGQCLQFSAQDQTSVLSVLQDGNVQWSKMFSQDSIGKIYEKLAEYKEEK